MTSANRGNTRRSPVPYHRREAAIERFSCLTGLRSVVVPVFDTRPTSRFAEVTLKSMGVAGLALGRSNTVVACSTPEVGFEVAGPSHAWRNDWIVANRIAPCADLATPTASRSIGR